eukprot:gene32959-48571_t
MEDATMRLCGVTDGSPAAKSDVARSCVGKVLQQANDAPTCTLRDALRATEGCTTIGTAHAPTADSTAALLATLGNAVEAGLGPLDQFFGLLFDPWQR